MNNVKPEQLDVDMYSIAKTIHSPIKIEDKVITERKTRGRSKVGINIHIEVNINKIE